MSILPVMNAGPFFVQHAEEPAISNLLSPEQSAGLRKIARIVDHPAGVPVFLQDDKAHFVFAVTRGCLRVSRDGCGSKRNILAFLCPGDWLGLSGNGRYVNSAETVQASALLQFPIDDLMGLLAQDPQLTLALLLKTSHELKRAQALITLRGLQRVDQRLAVFLLDLVEAGHFFHPAAAQLVLPMTRFDIADYLGSAPETVARAFARLEQKAILRRRSARVIEIRDLARLRHHADTGASSPAFDPVHSPGN